jgi:hypothetical protein
MVARQHRTRRSLFLRAAPAALWLLGVAACAEEPGEIVRQLDEAREECTHERLRAADAECVAMFDRYADMATDAIETYIGALRALDAALQRRTGIPFDTAGLGRAIGPSSGEALPEGRDHRGSWGLPERERVGAYLDPYGPGADPWRPEPDEGADRGGWGRSGAIGDLPRTGRGVLLPPGERLRRPWIDAERRDDYYSRERRPDLPGPWSAPEPWSGEQGYPHHPHDPSLYWP